MVVLLQTEQFKDLRGPCLELLVGIKVPRNEDVTDRGVISHVILGRCGCVATTSSRDLPVLSSHDLQTPQWRESWESVKGCLPGGCDVCGVCLGVGEGGKEGEIIRELLKKTDLPEVMGEGLILTVVHYESSLKVYQVDITMELCEVDMASVGDYLLKHTHLLRVTSSLPAHVNPQQATAERLLASLPGSCPAFLIPSLHLLLPNSPTSHSTPPHNTLRQLLQRDGSTSTDSAEAFLPVEMLEVHDCTGPLTLSLSSLSSSAELDLPIDALALVHLDLRLQEVCVVLWEAIERQLRAVAKAMLWKVGSLYNVAIHHFPPSTFHLCPISLPYPHTSVASPSSSPLNDSALTSLRQTWHTALCLPLDVPMLRTTNIHCFTSHHNDGPQLLCPHTKLTYSPQGTVAMVAGKYAYYHYMQDNFNDTGWGCAYRSLQTLWSWFNLQGFTSQTPPTHREIQEALVATGDKPPKFVGSKEWIGSFEVSTTLNHLLGVECRIHHVRNGVEMSGVGRVLLHHFTTQTTPVMIGGGVLAHTILGVDYNTRTGDIKFLVLDPHYTGRDDITTIVTKWWCGWKQVSFWDKKAHYNMCMPQRPREL